MDAFDIDISAPVDTSGFTGGLGGPDQGDHMGPHWYRVRHGYRGLWGSRGLRGLRCQHYPVPTARTVRRHLHLALVEIVGGLPGGTYTGVGDLYQFFLDLEKAEPGTVVPVTFAQDGSAPTPWASSEGESQ